MLKNCRFHCLNEIWNDCKVKRIISVCLELLDSSEMKGFNPLLKDLVKQFILIHGTRHHVMPNNSVHGWLYLILDRCVPWLIVKKIITVLLSWAPFLSLHQRELIHCKFSFVQNFGAIWQLFHSLHTAWNTWNTAASTLKNISFSPFVTILQSRKEM